MSFAHRSSCARVSSPWIMAIRKRPPVRWCALNSTHSARNSLGVMTLTAPLPPLYSPARRVFKARCRYAMRIIKMLPFVAGIDAPRPVRGTCVSHLCQSMRPCDPNPMDPCGSPGMRVAPRRVGFPVRSIIVFAVGMVLATAVSALAQEATTTSTSLLTTTSTVTTTSTSHTTSTSTTTSTLPPKNELKCASPVGLCVISTGTKTVSVATATLDVWPRDIRIDGDVSLIPNPFAPKVTLHGKSITISARASIKGEGGQVTLDTTPPLGSQETGGDIVLQRLQPGSTVAAQVDMSGPAGGGAVTARADGKIVIDGTLRAVGQDDTDGGDITLTANNGPLTIAPSTNTDDISVAGAQAGFGGTISLTTFNGDIVVNRRLDLSGGDGSLDIEANGGALTCALDIDTSGDSAVDN